MEVTWSKPPKLLDRLQHQAALPSKPSDRFAWAFGDAARRRRHGRAGCAGRLSGAERDRSGFACQPGAGSPIRGEERENGNEVLDWRQEMWVRNPEVGERLCKKGSWFLKRVHWGSR